MYKRQPLKGDFAWISKGSLAKGHKIEFELFSQLIDVGSIPNTIQNVRIYDEKGNVVTRNYRIAKKAVSYTHLDVYKRQRPWTSIKSTTD